MSKANKAVWIDRAVTAEMRVQELEEQLAAAKRDGVVTRHWCECGYEMAELGKKVQP